MQGLAHAPRHARGLVLLEALVAVGVLAVLAALAAPSFAAISERLKVRTAVQALTSSLYAARAEAFKRGGHVTLARNGSRPDCDAGSDGAQWRCGWEIFTDQDEDGARDAADELLQVGQPPPGIEVFQTARRAAFKLNAWGQFNGLGALGFVLRSRADADAVSVICVSSGGRLQSWSGVDRCPG
ncbi:GspH/FimT family protein [Variovorax sp. LARHSF232]